MLLEANVQQQVVDSMTMWAAEYSQVSDDQERLVELDWQIRMYHLGRNILLERL